MKEIRQCNPVIQHRVNVQTKWRGLPSVARRTQLRLGDSSFEVKGNPDLRLGYEKKGVDNIVEVRVRVEGLLQLSVVATFFDKQSKNKANISSSSTGMQTFDLLLLCCIVLCCAVLCCVMCIALPCSVFLTVTLILTSTSTFFFFNFQWSAVSIVYTHGRAAIEN